MPSQSAAHSTLAVPEELRKKYGSLIDLIVSSESMNDEERQYWINILPVMTEAQIGNLQQILQNERDQLAAIDAKYAVGDTKKQSSSVSLTETEQKIRKRTAARKGSEDASEEEEKKKEEELLRRIEGREEGSV